MDQGPRKAESSNYRFEPRLIKRVGFAAFLNARSVPDVVTPPCSVAGEGKDPNMSNFCCPNHVYNSCGFHNAGTDPRPENFRGPEKELGAISQVGLERGPPGGNSRRAKERMDHIEGRGERDDDKEILRKQSYFVTG